MSEEMQEAVLEDTRIDDCKVIPGLLQEDGTIEFTVTISIQEETGSIVIPVAT